MLYSYKYLCAIQNVPSVRGYAYSTSCSSCNFGYIGQTKRCLKDRLDEHCCKVKNEDMYSSSIASFSWSYNHNFDIRKVCGVSSLIFMELSTARKILTISLMTYLLYLLSVRAGNCLVFYIFLLISSIKN